MIYSSKEEIYHSKIIICFIKSEIRTLNGLLNRVKRDKDNAITEIKKLKATNPHNKIKSTVVSSSSSKRLTEELNMKNKEISKMEEDQVNSNGEITLLKDKLQYVEKQLDVAHRALQIENKYSRELNNAASAETMRTLYLEIGKRDADIHSLTLALAEAEKENSTVRKDLGDMSDLVNDLTTENTQLKTNISHLNSQVRTHIIDYRLYI